jgi:hypothetical protein
MLLMSLSDQKVIQMDLQFDELNVEEQIQQELSLLIRIKKMRIINYFFLLCISNVIFISSTSTNPLKVVVRFHFDIEYFCLMEHFESKLKTNPQLISGEIKIWNNCIHFI